MTFYKLTIVNLDGRNEDYSVNFENIEIKYIKTILNENTLFLFSNIIGTCNLKNGNLYGNSAGYLLNIIKIPNNVTLTNIIFDQNLVSLQVLNLEQIYFVSFKNLSCFNNNFGDFQKKGGCFRIKDSYQRIINEVKIINCFSGQKAVGLIVIDPKSTSAKLIKETENAQKNVFYV